MKNLTTLEIFKNIKLTALINGAFCSLVNISSDEVVYSYTKDNGCEERTACTFEYWDNGIRMFEGYQFIKTTRPLPLPEIVAILVSDGFTQKEIGLLLMLD